MAGQVIGADLSIPAGTPSSAPVTLVVPITSGWIPEVFVTFPAGPNGLVGWALFLAGSLIIPYGNSGWIIANDYTFKWKLNRWVNTGQLVVAGYNTGVFPHVIRSRFTVEATEPGLTMLGTVATGAPAELATAAAVGGLTGFAEDEGTANDLVSAGA